VEVKNVDVRGNTIGPVLTYNTNSGTRILREVETGLFFKDMNHNRELDYYEDWRNDSNSRAIALLNLMSLERKMALLVHDRPDEPNMVYAGPRVGEIITNGVHGVEGQPVLPGAVWNVKGKYADGRRFVWSAPSGTPVVEI
jgi:hypothetical protein